MVLVRSPGDFSRQRDRGVSISSVLSVPTCQNAYHWRFDIRLMLLQGPRSESPSYGARRDLIGRKACDYLVQEGPDYSFRVQNTTGTQNRVVLFSGRSNAGCRKGAGSLAVLWD